MWWSICRLNGYVSKLSEMAIDSMYMTDAIGTTNLTELQFESHDGVNYDIIELI